MNRDKIEEAARRLQKEIWQYRDRLWSNADLPPPHRLFTPEVASRVLAIDYRLVPGLGAFGDGHRRFEVAGAIDRQKNLIQISQQFDPRIQRFTGGHEIGHAHLHHDQIVMHRDRPISGLSAAGAARPLREREADYFSACYLAPRKVVREAFEARFGPIEQFRFGDDEAFGLCPSNPRSLTAASDDSLDWELSLASAIRYHGHFFESLADYFLLSVPTIAIRLREIGLRRSTETWA